jgi:hypothetical protein
LILFLINCILSDFPVTLTLERRFLERMREEEQWRRRGGE